MMENLFARVRADFSRARFKAFLNRLQSTLAGRPRALLAYDEVKTKLHLGGCVYRGVRSIPIAKIVGSLNRYQDFDRAFLPLQDQAASRWQNVDLAFYQEISLPPVVVYQVGEIYFVVDGHHRVSVAREQGQEFIDAEVRECSTKINLTADLKPEDLEILHDKVHFLEHTHLDCIRPSADIKLTIPDGFSRMLEHIAVHRYFLGLDWQRDISEPEAVADWYDRVYLPIMRVIRKSGVLKHFPGKTEGDLYLWVLDRQRYLSEKGQALQPPAQAAQAFVKKPDR